MTSLQKSAYDKVRAAKHKGLLKSPGKCERCNASEKFGKDGRSLLHGHHADYSKPLEVEWLCLKCHGKETRWPSGENHKKSILTSKLVQAAILLHDSGFKLVDIAEFYGVSSQCISHAVNGKNWIKERNK